MLQNIFRHLPIKNTRYIATSELTERQSYNFVHLLGYVILTFIAIDYVAILSSSQFFNPVWELQTIGKIIESVYLTLLGFMLVFFRPDKHFIEYNEIRVLAILSWLNLLLGMIFLLFIPLLISNSLRINNNNQHIMNLQLTNQRQQVEQVLRQINNLEGEKLQNIWVKNQQNLYLNADIPDLEKKQRLVNQINLKEQEKKQQLKQKFNKQRKSLFKSTFKWLLCTVISGISFISIWKYTEWTRELWKAKKQEFFSE